MKFRRKPIRWPNNARIAITTCVVTESWPDNLGTGKSLQSEFRKGLPSNAKFKRDICSITDRQYGERVGGLSGHGYSTPGRNQGKFFR